MEVATALKTKRLGSLPAFLALDSIDIGEAKLKGKKEKVIITLGRNLTEQDIKWYAEKTVYQPVKMPLSRKYELIIPKDQADKLLQVLVAI